MRHQCRCQRQRCGPPSTRRRPAETGQVIGLVTAALGIRAEASRRLADTLTEALRPRAMLLILDTCEHLVADVR